ncbi:MAG: nucleotide exchange factor GrpE [Acidimicrobiales bacterium]|nr:nucleotide exchange factor GrpE [Acidimicrobiales bacterium]
MPKDKDKRREDAEGAGGDEPSGVFDDLPWAEESPTVQRRPPGMGPRSRANADAGGGADPGGASDTGDGAPYTGPDRRKAEETTSELSEEALAEAALLVQNDFVALERERDDYLDQLRRVQADFENYRKRVIGQQADVVERAAESLVQQLLPVLDACDAAVQHGAEDVVPVQSQLVDTLTKLGLERLDPAGDAFDPNFHEAVMHEAGDGDDGPVVAEVLRTGYTWKGRVLRPAMVKVKG